MVQQSLQTGSHAEAQRCALYSQRKVQSHRAKKNGEFHPPRSLLLPQYGVLRVLSVPTSGPADPSLRVGFGGCLCPLDISCSGYHTDPHEVGREDQAGKNQMRVYPWLGLKEEGKGCWRDGSPRTRKFTVVDFAGVSLLSSAAFSLRGALASVSLPWEH